VVCEAARAFRELTGRVPEMGPGSASECSPERPEPRSYPASPGRGSPPYILCNGHLRDLFAAMASSRT
jgi:hypothetical protein